MKIFLRKLLFPLIRRYWRIFRPKTFGVKVLIFNPDNHEEFLLVRHSYGDETRWNLPGGGYRPKREKPIQAAVREVREELQGDLVNPVILGKYQTNLEGKRDTVIFVVGSLKNKEKIIPIDEIKEVVWKNRKDVVSETNVAMVVKRGLEFLAS